MPTDYEAEYNNRARCPSMRKSSPGGHAMPKPIAMTRRPKTTPSSACASGRRERQIHRPVLPDRRQQRSGRAVHPWRLLALARAADVQPRRARPQRAWHRRRGAGYDLCPQVTVARDHRADRGAPASTCGAASAAHDGLRPFGRRPSRRLHAGDRLEGGSHPTYPADLVPTAFAISGVFDLTPLIKVSMNGDLRLDRGRGAQGVAGVLARRLPDATLEAWCGARESSEFLRQNRIIVDAWSRPDITTRLRRDRPGANHFTVLDPLSDPGSDMVARVAAMCERTQVRGSVTAPMNDNRANCSTSSARARSAAARSSSRRGARAISISTCGRPRFIRRARAISAS